MDTRDWLKEQLDKLSDLEYAELWNKYCEENRNDEQMLHPMEEFNAMFKDCTPLEIADIGSSCTAFNVNDDWFVAKECYGWEVTSDDDARYLTEEDELLDYIEKNAGDFNFLDDLEYRKAVSEGFEEWDEFEAWFDEEYGCNMFEFDIEVLLDEWEQSKQD